MKYIVNPNQITITTDVAGEPVTRAQQKAHSKIDHTDEDSLVDSLISAARRHVESATGRAMVERTYRADLPGFADDIRLPFPPLQSIVSIKYYSTASPSVFTTLSDTTSSPLVTSTLYRVDLPKGRILRAYGSVLPDADVRHDAVQITFKAGYAPTGSPLDYTAPVEDDLRAAVKLIAADMYENREARGVGQGMMPYENHTVKAILDQYRHWL